MREEWLRAVRNTVANYRKVAEQPGDRCQWAVGRCCPCFQGVVVSTDPLDEDLLGDGSICKLLEAIQVQEANLGHILLYIFRTHHIIYHPTSEDLYSKPPCT